MAKVCHPNVVRYHCSWLENKPLGMIPSEWEEEEEDELVPMLCIQQELCDGTLDDKLYKGPIAKEMIWSWFRQIAEAIGYLHSNNICHCDLSPKNLFFDKTGEVLKVGDFGLASLSSEGVLGDDEIPKTDYCPPELKKDKRFCLKSDIYRLGLILLVLFSNFKTAHERHIELEKFKVDGEPPNSATELDHQTLSIIARMTCPKPEDRISSSDLLAHSPWSTNPQ